MYIYGYHILLVILWGAAVVTTAFALWKGDAAVRYAALIHIAVEIAAFIVNPKFGDVSAESVILAVDFVSSVTLLLLAVRYAALWLGATMLLQSALFGLHAYYLVMELPHDVMHAWINNSFDWGIDGCIVAGTIAAIRRRVVLAREDAEREARRKQFAARV